MRCLCLGVRGCCLGLYGRQVYLTVHRAYLSAWYSHCTHVLQDKHLPPCLLYKFYKLRCSIHHLKVYLKMDLFENPRRQKGPSHFLRHPQRLHRHCLLALCLRLRHLLALCLRLQHLHPPRRLQHLQHQQPSPPLLRLFLHSMEFHKVPHPPPIPRPPHRLRLLRSLPRLLQAPALPCPSPVYPRSRVLPLPILRLRSRQQKLQVRTSFLETTPCPSLAMTLAL